MAIDVLVVQTESEGGFCHWVEGGPAPQLAEWERAALWLARRASEQRDFRADIFLCLRGDYLVDKFEHEFCRALTEVARRYGWGTKLYIAVDETIDLKPEQLDIIPSLSMWLKELTQSGYRATDLVLANFHRMTELEQYHVTDLRWARDESASRYDMLPGLITPDQWSPWAASREYQPWLEDISEKGARNLMIVIKGSGAMGRESRPLKRAISCAKEKIEELPNGRFVLCWLGRGIVPEDVVKLSRRYKIPILRFRGLLELQYFLVRLNLLCRGQAAALTQTVEAVTVEKQVFRFWHRRRPRLLITSAFHPDESETNCLDAAKEVGEIMRAAPANAECYIHPYFRAVDLPDLLKRMPELTAWLHLGHGDASGMKDVGGGLIDLGEWLARLQHSDMPLPLVFLSVCESAAVARKFAAAGVGVAVGFEKKVLPEICSALAVPTIFAALNSGGSRRAILQAYDAALKDTQWGTSIFKPKAFYSVL